MSVRDYPERTDSRGGPEAHRTLMREGRTSGRDNSIQAAMGEGSGWCGAAWSPEDHSLATNHQDGHKRGRTPPQKKPTTWTIENHLRILGGRKIPRLCANRGAPIENPPLEVACFSASETRNHFRFRNTLSVWGEGGVKQHTIRDSRLPIHKKIQKQKQPLKPRPRQALSCAMPQNSSREYDSARQHKSSLLQIGIWPSD